MLVPLAAPSWIGQTLCYRTRARPKKTFHTILDAADLVVDGEPTVVSFSEALTLSVEVPLRTGRLDDRVDHAPVPHDGGIHIRRLERRVTARDGRPSREEIVDFASSTHALPPCTYVEVSTPFLLGGQPFDGQARSLYAWICDRFVAKVYYESRGRESITVPAGRFDVREVIMYPDLNDWVKMPAIIGKLSRPFLPKYRMWYEEAAPHRLVMFEGPYGPPGAPEIILELQSV